MNFKSIYVLDVFYNIISEYYENFIIFENKYNKMCKIETFSFKRGFEKQESLCEMSIYRLILKSNIKYDQLRLNEMNFNIEISELYLNNFTIDINSIFFISKLKFLEKIIIKNVKFEDNLLDKLIGNIK